MLNLPNLLSLFRIPLALAFLHDDVLWRLGVLFLALLTDGLDGFLARRQGQTSSFGTLLDPITDKFFVIFTLGILLSENTLPVWNVVAMLCRDISVAIFGVYLLLSSQLGAYRFRAIWSGKVTTVLQFAVLMGLTLHFPIRQEVFVSFFVLGVLALGELYFYKKTEKRQFVS